MRFLGNATFLSRRWSSRSLAQYARFFHRFQSSSKAFSTALARSDRVTVPVGSNGSVNLEYDFLLITWPLRCIPNLDSIYHPASSPSAIKPVIIYLPRGPVTYNGLPEPSNLASLASAANTTVVRLGYRLSRSLQYPLPIHDVLTGYDWIVQHLVRGPYGEPNDGKVAVCGELIGGSLAAALALTECHSVKTGIRAAVMGNPISDWTAMHHIDSRATAKQPVADGVTPTSKKKRAPRLSSWESNASNSTLSASSLLKARRELFHSAEDYYDLFASPTLFFRTPSSDIPMAIDPLDELFMSPENIPQQQAKKRRSYRRYPGLTSNLRLPDTMIWVGEGSILKDQGIDLAEGIARSNHLYGGPGGTGEGTGWERVDVEIMKGVGAWGEAELVQIGTWLGERLKS